MGFRNASSATGTTPVLGRDLFYWLGTSADQLQPTIAGNAAYAAALGAPAMKLWNPSGAGGSATYPGVPRTGPNGETGLLLTARIAFPEIGSYWPGTAANGISSWWGIQNGGPYSWLGFGFIAVRNNVQLDPIEVWAAYLPTPGGSGLGTKVGAIPRSDKGFHSYGLELYDGATVYTLDGTTVLTDTTGIWPSTSAAYLAPQVFGWVPSNGNVGPDLDISQQQIAYS